MTTGSRWRSTIGALRIVAMCLLACTSHAERVRAGIILFPEIQEFPLPTPTGGPTQDQPEEITAGPDGNLWFTENEGNRIGQITPDGVITEFDLPNEDSGPFSITTGPDGNLWFTEGSAENIGAFP